MKTFRVTFEVLFGQWSDNGTDYFDVFARDAEEARQKFYEYYGRHETHWVKSVKRIG